MYHIWPLSIIDWLRSRVSPFKLLSKRKIFYHGHVPFIYLDRQQLLMFYNNTSMSKERKFNGSKKVAFAGQWTLKGLDNCTIYNFTLNINICSYVSKSKTLIHTFGLIRIGHLIALKSSVLVAFLCDDHVYHYALYCPSDTELWVS